MNRRSAGFLALALLLPLPAGLHAQGTFEGMVAYRTEQAGGGPAGEMRYFQKGSRIRHEMQVGTAAQTAVSIFNGATGESIMLMPGRKQYMSMNMKQMAAQMGGQMGPRTADRADLSKARVRATGKREVIAGIPCEHYIFGDATTGEVDICGAAGMGFMGGGAQGPGGLPTTAALAQSSNPQLAALGRRGFFPLRMTMSGRGNTSTWTATKVDRHALDASLFGPPAGYTKLEMPGMPPGMPAMPKR